MAPLPCEPCTAEHTALLNRKDNFEGFALFVAVLTVIGFFIYCAIKDEISRRCRYMQFCFPLLFLFAVASYTTTQLVMVYRLPEYLAFGTKVGGFLPSTCEESQALLGEYKWPCYMAQHGTSVIVGHYARITLILVAVVTAVAVPMVRNEHKKVLKRKTETERRELAQAIGEKVLQARELEEATRKMMTGRIW